MIVHDINPIIVSLGPLSIRWYSLAYVIGFLLAYWWLMRLSKQGAIRNLTPERAEEFMVLLIAGVIVGGRFFEFVFFEPYVLFHDPLEVLRIWHGGMSFHGGLIGVALVAWWFTRKHRISMLELGDALAVPAAFALFLGRLANFVNGELWGRPTVGSPWYCVDYSQSRFIPSPPEGCRHPSQIYEALKNLAVTAVLLWQWGKKRQKGLIMWLFITLYGLGRFAVDFWRDDPRVLWGLGMGQVLSLIMFFVGVAGLWWVTRRR